MATTEFHIPSYPKVYALGHRYVLDIFSSKVVVQEKIDGSQFSFAKDEEGTVHFRSKGATVYPEAADKMFRAAVEHILSASGSMRQGIYRGEVLSKPKHNALAYDRVPNHNIILYDADNGQENYSTGLSTLADEIGLEIVPTLFTGVVEGMDALRELLETPSILGGQKVEGIVVKNYSLMTQDKKAMMGKLVGEVFKEVHSGEWRKANPTRLDMISEIIADYRTPARWEKALQHMDERGDLLGDPKDIGSALKEIMADVLEECGDEMRETLFKHAWKQIGRGITAGFPKWYKEKLAAKSFTERSDQKGEEQA